MEERNDYLVIEKLEEKRDIETREEKRSAVLISTEEKTESI